MNTTETAISKCLAPEEIRVGDYLAVLSITGEYPPFLWCGADASVLPPAKLVRLEWLPTKGAGDPLRVEAVSLPFVFVKSANGRQFSLDVRRVKVARLDGSYGERVYRAHRKARAKAKKREAAAQGSSKK